MIKPSEILSNESNIGIRTNQVIFINGANIEIILSKWMTKIQCNGKDD